MDSSVSLLVESIHKLLAKRLHTLSLAESCTGGLVAGYVTDRPGISDVFKGCVVAYHNDVKRDALGVLPKDLEAHGAVSQVVAIKMALGAREKLKSTWSVSITGIAGPGGGSPNKPVGTVWFAVVGPNFEGVEHKIFKGDREAVRKASVTFALEFLEKTLKEQT